MNVSLDESEKFEKNAEAIIYSRGKKFVIALSPHRSKINVDTWIDFTHGGPPETFSHSIEQ